MLKVNIGAGNYPLDGYENIDRKTGQEAYPLGYADNSVDEVRASHVLEHFSHQQVSKVIADWVRVLKPGGLLKLAVPDFKWIAENYLAGKAINVQGYTMGGHLDADDQHGTIFDKENLYDLMQSAGLIEISRWTSEGKDCSLMPVSLNLCGRKPGPAPTVDVGAAMSVPRLGFQDNMFSCVQALAPMGIFPCKYDGAYWEQCIERVLIDLSEKHEWVLCIDYDSVFTRRHVEALLWLAVRHPECDAIASVQMRRSGDLPLLTKRDEHGAMLKECPSECFEHPLWEIDTAHFGLTLLRSSALQKLQHPWFWGQPSDDGLWGEGRTDADIYFWKKWKAAGNKLHLANRVVVGHAQLMVTWPSCDGGVIHQYPSEFWDKGVPERTWE